MQDYLQSKVVVAVRQTFSSFLCYLRQFWMGQKNRNNATGLTVMEFEWKNQAVRLNSISD